MAIAVRASSTGSVGNNNSVTITEPSGTTNGDIVIAIVGLFTGANISYPSGWTGLGAYNNNAATGAAAYYMRGASAPADMDFTWSGNRNGEWTCITLSGGDNSDTTTPSNTAADAGTGTSVVNPPVTASTFTAPVGVVGGGTNASGGITKPSDIGAGDFFTTDTECLMFIQRSTGTTYDIGACGGPSNAAWIGFSLAFAEAGGGPAATYSYPMMHRMGL